jgi:hypothetical protein
MTHDDMAPASTGDALSKALDRGAIAELPENQPPGWLGEVAPDMRKTEEFTPSVNAGLLQEDTSQTRWLLILVLYVLVFTAPAAAWLLWREPRRSVKAKIVTSVIGVAGYIALFLATSSFRPAG